MNKDQIANLKDTIGDLRADILDLTTKSGGPSDDDKDTIADYRLIILDGEADIALDERLLDLQSELASTTDKSTLKPKADKLKADIDTRIAEKKPELFDELNTIAIDSAALKPAYVGKHKSTLQKIYADSSAPQSLKIKIRGISGFSATGGGSADSFFQSLFGSWWSSD